eukprot:6883119-Prymnesium_polylepis.2
MLGFANVELPAKPYVRPTQRSTSEHQPIPCRKTTSLRRSAPMPLRQKYIGGLPSRQAASSSPTADGSTLTLW